MTVVQLQLEIQSRVEKASVMSNGELVAALIGARDVMWDTILDVCVFSVEAERRKLLEDDEMEIVEAFIPKYRKRIASGQVSPRAWMKYVDRPAVLSVIALLPFNEQEAFVDGKRVIVFGTVEGEKYNPVGKRQLAPHQMTDDQLRYVFKPGGGGIRNEVEQKNQAAKLARRSFNLRGELRLKLNEEDIEHLTLLASRSGKKLADYCREALRKLR